MGVRRGTSSAPRGSEPTSAELWQLGFLLQDIRNPGEWNKERMMTKPVYNFVNHIVFRIQKRPADPESAPIAWNASRRSPQSEDVDGSIAASGRP